MRGRFAIIGVVLLAACSGPAQERPAGTLPAAPGAPYRVSLKTYDNGYCDNPFSLSIQTTPPKLEGEAPSEKLRSGPMCKNVDVVQTPSRLYVFYEVLSLKYFHNTGFEPEPRILLCDLAMQSCRDERARLLTEGGKAYNVCTCRDPSPDVIEPFPAKEAAK